jgi:uncharacterized membrane protein YfcA
MASTDDKQSDGMNIWLRYLLALLVVLAVGSYVGATLGGWVKAERRLDTNSIVLIVLAAGFVFLIVTQLRSRV